MVQVDWRIGDDRHRIYFHHLRAGVSPGYRRRIVRDGASRFAACRKGSGGRQEGGVGSINLGAVGEGACTHPDMSFPVTTPLKGGIMKSDCFNVFRWICRFVAFSLISLSTGVGNATAENGVTKKEILIGQSIPLTGPLGELGKDASTAAKAYFDFINEQGGIHGRKIRFITLDDAYNTEKCNANVKHLIKSEGVFALFHIASTAANMALLPTITEDGIPYIAPFTGSEALRKPFNRFLFHVRASYGDETEKIVEHLEVRGINKVAVVYINNAFGKEGLSGVEQALAKRKLKIHATAPIEVDGSNAAKAAEALFRSKPQAVVMVTAGRQSVDFIKAYNGLAPGMQFFTLSVMGTQASVTALGKDGVGVVVSQVVPFPFSATSGIIREYQKIMTKMGVNNRSFSSMEGFVNAKVTVEGLRRAGSDLTRERFINAMESMDKVDFDGYVIDFNKSNHQGSHYVDLTVISKQGRFLR
jgi:ABC-type branched-subunit amino acid transport system substrate-binding protein